MEGLELKSVLKKLKIPLFVVVVNREDIHAGPDLVGLPLDEHIRHCVTALQAVAPQLGLA